MESAKEVKLFGLNAYIAERYRIVAAKLLDDNRSLAIRRAGWGGLFAALGTLAYYAAYATIVWRTVAGVFSIGDLAFLAGSFQRLRSLIEGLLLGFSQISSQAQYLEDLFSFFEVVPLIRSPERPVPFPQPITEGIVFEEVGFRYPGTETWAVRSLSFRLAAGEVLALVGENGAGKTTIVKLLTRLYDPTEGRVLLDGRPLSDYDLDDLRARIGVIFQDFVRFDFTAAENVAVGRIEEREDAARIARAAGRSLADGVIERLPLGYDQPLGKRFADGVDLSGGQWQKIALSRAYMREAEILILDEPTAALDARAEFEVFQRFRDLSRGRSCVPDLAPLFHRAHGRPHPRPRRGQGHRGRNARGTSGEGRALRRIVRTAGRRLPLRRRRVCFRDNTGATRPPARPEGVASRLQNHHCTKQIFGPFGLPSPG